MKKFLIYYSFIIVSLIVIAGFLSARTYPQLITAVLFFPLFTYFAVRVFPRRTKAIILPAKATVLPVNSKRGEKEDKEVIKLKKEGVDIDRRAFLKLIGSAGLSLFLFSLFTKRAEAAFFGSVPGPGTVSIKDSAGVKIDPAEKHPTDGYSVTEIDDAGSDTYIGFIKKGGAWYIIKEIGAGSDSSYRYTKGSSDFITNWTGRTGLTYGYYDDVFV
jgi:hypothetical protein